MTQKFKVGDKVRVIDASYSEHSNGDIGEIVSLTLFRGKLMHDVVVNGVKQGHYAEDIELINAKPTKKQRLSDAEKQLTEQATRIAELEAKVAALEKAQKQPIRVGEVADVYDNGTYIGKFPHLPQTPNEQRKAIIAEAKAFVAENLAKNHQTTPQCRLGVWFTDSDGSFITDKAVFHVNDKKRVVTCLIVDVDAPSDVAAKAIAKCAPDDVFNADIGKAIALGRALGLDVKRFEQAVKPTKPVIGMMAEIKGNCFPYVETINAEGTGDRHSMTAVTRSEDNTLIRILDDTNAEY